MSRFEKLAAAAALVAATGACGKERSARPNVSATVYSADYEIGGITFLNRNRLGPMFRTGCGYREEESDAGERPQRAAVQYECEQNLDADPAGLAVLVNDRGVGPMDCSRLRPSLQTRNGRRWTDRELKYAGYEILPYSDDAECIYAVMPQIRNRDAGAGAGDGSVEADRLNGRNR